jgi:hypothetical protein
MRVSIMRVSIMIVSTMRASIRRVVAYLRRVLLFTMLVAIVDVLITDA